MSFYMLGKDLSWGQDKDEAEDLRKCHITEDSRWLAVWGISVLSSKQ